MIYRAQRLLFAYQVQPILDLRDLEIPKGSRFLIEGPNGSGKTTLTEIMAGLLAPQTGTLELFDREMRLPLPASMRARIAYMAQQPYPLPGSVLDNLLLACDRKLEKDQRRRRALDALDRLGILPLADRTAGKLSVGQMRRVALGRILMRNAEVWLLDEPFAFADDAYRKTLERILEERHQAGMTTILTSPGSEKSERWATHSLRLAGPDACSQPEAPMKPLRVVR